ncbi:hypothetical protein E4U55_003653 [Claviceps digitariae]|nr:hypothetical protein E4U55_003653 [Claviceps digitariae]
MAHKSPQPARHGFAIFDDCSPASKHEQTTTTPLKTSSDPDVLRELSKGKSQIRALPIIDIAATSPTKSPRRESPRLEAKPTKCQAVRFSPRVQRPQAHAETFEPLVSVPEESASLVESRDAVGVTPSLAEPGENQATSAQPRQEKEMLLSTAASNLSLEEQVEKHLAGQFEWIMTYPAGAGSRAAGDGISKSQGGSSSPTFAVYGCNMLPARRRQRASHTSAGLSTDVFALLATALTKDSCHYPSMAEHKDVVSPGLGLLCQLPPPPYPGTPEKVSEVTTEVEQALSSPSLPVAREGSDSIASGSSRAGSFSVPLLEDSLEELDKLEEELDAVRETTRTRQQVTDKDKAVRARPGDANTKAPTSKVNKRLSIAGYSATVRVKPCQEKPPSSRRSSSLTLRDKKTLQQGSSSEGLKVEATPCRQGQRATSRLSTPKLPIKSSKPTTVPKFELPGEAVARRLKEQREARLAQQAEAQKAQASPAPKPRLNKLLALPTFELPGEAISRRKREEREAKLRAEEEEAKRRREFKARPVRQSIGPATAPRETLTSRVRQSKPLPQATGDVGIRQNRRLSVGLVGNNARASLANNKSSQTRGRELVNKDNNSNFGQERNKEKQERETSAKTVREQAAERSRMASREWAEKMRRKGLAGGQAKENQDDKTGTQA